MPEPMTNTERSCKLVHDFIAAKHGKDYWNKLIAALAVSLDEAEKRGRAAASLLHERFEREPIVFDQG